MVARDFEQAKQEYDSFEAIIRANVPNVYALPYADGPEACLHLMSIVSFVDTDKAVVYSKYMPVFFRNYLLEKGFELIECGDAEYDYLGTNLLALEPKKCVLIQGCPGIQKKLEEKGIEVLTYKGQEISYKGTGGLPA